MTDFMRYATKRERREWASFVGPMSEMHAVLGALDAAGWRVTSRGPYISKKTFPLADLKRFKIVAERVIDEDPTAG